jgi:hypothetical protein
MKKTTKTPKNKGGQTQNRTVDTRIFNPTASTKKLGENAKKRKCGTIAGQGAKETAVVRQLLASSRTIIAFAKLRPCEQRAALAAAEFAVALSGGA